MNVCRHKDLVRLVWGTDVTLYDHIDAIGESIYSVQIMQTKTLSKKSGVVELFLADHITHYLFHVWYTNFLPNPLDADGHWHKVFPLITTSNKLDWTTSYSHENHKEACLEVAVHVGLPVSHDQKHGYTSNCVRRGVAASLGQDMKNLLHQHNLNFGRAANSRIDLDVYCPEDILQVDYAEIYKNIYNKKVYIYMYIYKMRNQYTICNNTWVCLLCCLWFQRFPMLPLLNFPACFLQFSCMFPAGFLQVSCMFPARFLHVSYNFLIYFLGVFCWFPAGLLHDSCKFPASFLHVSCMFPAWFLEVPCRFPTGFLYASCMFAVCPCKVSCMFPVGYLYVSCSFLLASCMFPVCFIHVSCKVSACFLQASCKLPLMFLACLLYVSCKCPVCFLHVSFMFSACFLHVFCKVSACVLQVP